MVSAKPTAVGRKILTALASGATLKSWRLYPYSPHTHTLKTPAGNEGTPAKEQTLGLPTVASLVGAGWLKSRMLDKLGDEIGYELTDAGRTIADEVPA